jgi:hypothetical protein
MIPQKKGTVIQMPMGMVFFASGNGVRLHGWLISAKCGLFDEFM